MKRSIIIHTLLLTIICIPLSSQVSENHIGIRGGIHSGVYYQNLSGIGTAEIAFFAMLSANKNSVRATIMKIVYETSLSEVNDNLFFTWGYGGHVGFALTDYTYFMGDRYQFSHERYRMLGGIDGWAGLEYRFIQVPMTIGVNVKPYLEIMTPGFFTLQPGDIGISIAYRF